MDRQRLLDAFPLAQTMMRDGIVLVGNGPERAAKCPFHPDRRPSMSVNVVKQTWYCQVCGIGGSVIDYIAQRQGMTIDDTLAKLSEEVPASPTTAADRSAAEPFRGGTPVATYVYRSAIGEEVFRVLRYEPKTFRQQKKTGTRWDWGMDGVERVLYRLPEILQETGKPIWINEGEKDVDNLVRYRQNATCNVGGAGKWMDGYTSALSGKDVIICGDNDDAGVLHVKTVIEALDGKVKRLRVITLPKPYKDISDFLTQFGALDAGEAALNELVDKSAVMMQGGTVPILSMAEMEARYIESIQQSDQRGYSFRDWLPTLARRVRNCVAGDVICFVGSTGAGKTFLLQNMAFRAAPLPTLLFEMELADSITFERFVAGVTNLRCDDVESFYRDNKPPDWRATRNLNNIYVCTQSSLKVSKIEEIVNRAELKMGVRPVLVQIDYAQLLNGTGKGRYEQMTSAMADLKSLAKNCGVIIVVASQIARTEEIEVGLYSGKDSGQLENSASLHIGFWRDKNDDTLLHMRVNKNTKGRSGWRIQCNFDGAKGIITERINATN